MVVAKVRIAGHEGVSAITSIFFNNSGNLKYAVIFAYEGKSNTYFMCVHSQYKQNVMLL